MIIYKFWNKFFSVKIDGFTIPKNSYKLIKAYQKLIRLGYNYKIIDDTLIIDFLEYKLHTNCYDESFLMSIDENTRNDEYNLNDISLNDKIVLDVGANIGDTALSLIHKGALKVYSVEPVMETFKYLSMNITGNRLERKIIPINYGLSSFKGELDIVIRDHASGGNSITYSNRNSAKKVYNKTTKVKTITVIDLLKHTEPDNGRIEILKMDCEGCEYEVNLEQLIQGLPLLKHIFIEYHQGCSGLADMLTNLGFKVRIRPKSNRLGVILAEKLT